MAGVPMLKQRSPLSLEAREKMRLRRLQSIERMLGVREGQTGKLDSPREVRVMTPPQFPRPWKRFTP